MDGRGIPPKWKQNFHFEKQKKNLILIDELIFFDFPV
jgi:hypothetical protein